jgi:hypothetical protein
MRKGSGTINNLQSTVLHYQTYLSISLEAFAAIELDKIFTGITVLQRMRDGISPRNIGKLSHLDATV